MATINDKLEAIKNAKDNIKDTLVLNGIDMSDKTFEDYAEVIGNLMGDMKTLEYYYYLSVLRAPVLNNLKSTLYYNCNEYMKVDYRGTVKYDVSKNDYGYSSEWITQHMYYDDDLSTFIPCLPYQDPFKAVVTLKMPLAFSNDGWSKQQIIMCQDFVLGDGQDDHAAMCPKWYSWGGMEWGGSMFNGGVVRYTENTSNLSIYTNTDIDISFGTNAVQPYKFLTAFIYPLIKVTDSQGRVYSPMLISVQDTAKTKINERYCWMTNTNDISTLDKTITNTNYKQNISNFLIEHITQINLTFFGNDGKTLPTSTSNLKSTRLQTWNKDGKEGILASLPSVIKNLFDSGCKIELSTIDIDGNVISCGNANSYTALLNNFAAYKNYVADKIPSDYIVKYPWLY